MHFNLIEPVALCFMALKFLHLFKLLEVFSPLNSQAARLIFTISGSVDDRQTLLKKAWFAQYQNSTLGVCFLTFLTIASYIVMVSERSNLYMNYGFSQLERCYKDDE